MNNNLEVRSEILEYSLLIEDLINSILLINLGLSDGGSTTRLFGKKGNISFKNKIDLLHDICVLSKEENAELELLMVFRNKFLHDIECNSFQNVLLQLDNSIKNKFKLYFKNAQNIENEDHCRTACSSLFYKNIATLKNKVKEHRIKYESVHERLSLQRKVAIFQIDGFYGLINDLYLILENSELEDKKVQKLAEDINEKCQFYIKEYNENEEMVVAKKRLLELSTDVEMVKALFGIRKMSRDGVVKLKITTDINK